MLRLAVVSLAGAQIERGVKSATNYGKAQGSTSAQTCRSSCLLIARSGEQDSATTHAPLLPPLLPLMDALIMFISALSLQALRFWRLKRYSNSRSLCPNLLFLW
jgi:hypothetical protein